MGADMVQGLHENDRSMRLVRATIEKRELLAVDWLPQKPLPPCATLLGTGDKLIQVVRLVFMRGPVRATAAQTGHVARVCQDEMIQGRHDAAEPQSRTCQLVRRTLSTCSHERLHGPEFVPESLEQDLVHRHSASVRRTTSVRIEHRVQAPTRTIGATRRGV